MVNHLAVYSRNRGKDYIQMMFDGIKTVDIKLSNRKVAPFNAINSNDILYIKESSGPVVGRIRIPKVSYYEINDPVQILDILIQIRGPVGLEDDEHVTRMFQKVCDKRYVTVFELENPEPLLLPIRINKFDRRVWIQNYTPSMELKLAYGIEPMTEMSSEFLEMS
jgi:predicted transcriptional regulator